MLALGEAAALQAGITAAERALCDDEQAAQLRVAEKLLGSLRAELDEPLTPVVQASPPRARSPSSPPHLERNVAGKITTGSDYLDIPRGRAHRYGKL
jgi:hypothetical protein